MSQEYNKYDTDYYIKYDLVDPSLGAINAGMTNGSITGNYNEWAMRSYFGRINLNWDNKYLLEANLRADGSSKFAPGNRWDIFRPFQPDGAFLKKIHERCIILA